MKVLVIGATGMLGAPVTRELVKAGHQVSALVRRADAKLPAGVQARTGDLFDAAALDRAMSGVDALYLNLATQPTDREQDRLVEREGLAGILAAAKRNKVQRVAMLSALVAHHPSSAWWVLRVKREAERTLLESGLDVAVFRCSSFLENLNGSMRQGAKVNVAGTAQHPSYYLSAADLGRMVARAFELPQQGAKVWVVQGPEPVLTGDAAKRFVATYTQESLKVQAAPLGVLRFIGLFSRSLGFVASMLGALNTFKEDFAAQSTWDALGKPTTTVEDYARSL